MLYILYKLLYIAVTGCRSRQKIEAVPVMCHIEVGVTM